MDERVRDGVAGPLRIVVVNNFYPPRVGGSSHLSDALARGYAARGLTTPVAHADPGRRGRHAVLAAAGGAT